MRLPLLLLATFVARTRGSCAWWGESTAHSASFRNVREFGAVGDGRHDDTAAIQAAIDANQTGGDGSGLGKSAAIVYIPEGTYLISDTLVLWFFTTLYGNPVCPPTLLLAPSAAGFEGPALKPIIATNVGQNISASHHAWWVQYDTTGGHANDLFYIHIRDFRLVAGEGNAGATGILWLVAQQSSIRGVTIDLSASLNATGVGIDQGGGEEYTKACIPSLSLGGGGSIENVTTVGGRFGLRIDSSQWSYVNVVTTRASVACVAVVEMSWAQTFVHHTASFCPVAFLYAQGDGHLLLLDSTLGPGLGAVAIATDGTSALYLQAVTLLRSDDSPASLVDALLPAPAGHAPFFVSSWAAGRVYDSGVQTAPTTPRASSFLPLPTLAGCEAAHLPRACLGRANLCGGSAEDPRTGLPASTLRPSFVGAPVANAVTDYGAVGDGVHDDTLALQAALDGGGAVFLPHGTYAISDTLHMRCGSALIGEGLPTIALFASSRGFNDSTLLKAMVATPPNASCAVTLVEIALSTLGVGNDGALMLDHRAGEGSGLWDVTIRGYYRVGLKARFGPPLSEGGGDAAPGQGGGILSNTHFWIADHNLTDMGEMNCSAPSCFDHKPVGGDNGVLITTSGPLFLVGTNWEHSGVLEYALVGASNVVTTAVQTEGTLTSMLLDTVTLVTVYGALWGSGTGHHNVTLMSRREVSGRNCAAAEVEGGGATTLDASWRLLGVLSKLPLVSALIDTRYTVVADAGEKGSWMPASFLNSGC